MPKLSVFNHVTLDGYFTDVNNSMHWAYQAQPDEEWNAFVAENAGSGGRLVMGRVTYELMIQYWPTPMAEKNDPAVAKGMNTMQKYVFSRTLKEASWSNTAVLSGDLATEARRLKTEPGDDMVILGSGKIVAQLAAEGLIDEYQLVVNPLVLGAGRTLFEGVPNKIGLKLLRSRTFGNGNVFLSYQPE